MLGLSTQLLWALLILQVHPVSATFNKPQVRVTTTFGDFNARIMDHWGAGGGNWATIPKKVHHPFEGRTFGAAKRSEIRGTRVFGSGYPYGATNQSSVAKRPFPFGTWPLYWDNNFMEADVYGPQHDAIRPGGFVASVPLRTTPQHFNVTDDEVYYAIGDRESLLFLMISYVTWCHVTPAWPTRFDPTAPNSTIRLENVIQYFRASSFALASPAYNNTHARTSTWDSTPLSESMEYSSFRKCLDSVAENALAILNKPAGPTPLGKFITALIAGGIYICGAMLAVLFGLIMVLVFIRVQFQKWLYGDPALIALARQERVTTLQYERYP